MNSVSEKKKGAFPYGTGLLIVVGLLVLFGLYMVYSASYVGVDETAQPWSYLLKQVAGLVLGVLLGYVFYLVPSFSERGKRSFIIVFFAGALIALIFAYTLGPVLGGSRRWIQLPFFNIQPSEFLKIALILVTALILTKRRKHILLWFLGCMIVPGLVAIENLSTGLLMALAVFIMFCIYGLKARQVLILSGGVLAGGVFFALIEPYRMSRLVNYVAVLIDPMKADYQAKQSLYALANGSIFGRGITNSKQKFYYLPEHHTDFIFAIIGEELGFLGELIVIIAFFIMIYLIFQIGLSSEDSFSRYSCIGFGALLGAQILLNIGVVSAAFPVTGVTLPFLSYGGSSLMATLTIIGFILGASELGKGARHAKKFRK